MQSLYKVLEFIGTMMQNENKVCTHNTTRHKKHSPAPGAPGAPIVGGLMDPAVGVRSTRGSWGRDIDG